MTLGAVDLLDARPHEARELEEGDAGRDREPPPYVPEPPLAPMRAERGKAKKRPAIHGKPASAGLLSSGFVVLPVLRQF